MVQDPIFLIVVDPHLYQKLLSWSRLEHQRTTLAQIQEISSVALNFLECRLKMYHYHLFK